MIRQSKILDRTGKPYVVGSFEGASRAPRMSSFVGSGIGPNAAIEGSLNTLRARSRQAIRNNCLAKGGAGTFVANMVGAGIAPRFQFEGDLKKEVQELWADSVPEMDHDENTDFYGQQAVVANALFSDGETLCLFRPCSPYDDLAVPLQVQLIEADHLDVSYATTLPNGNKVRQGIEYNRRGKRVRYHLFKDHPGEAYLNCNYGREPWDAADVMHVFDPTRPGQQRGLPSLSSILVKLHEIDQCVDAELVRRKTTAMLVGIIKRMEAMGDRPPSPLGIPSADSTAERPAVELTPGTTVELLPGEDIVFSKPTDVSGSYIAWMKQQLMDVARGMGITYEQLTGDLNGVTYGSIRAGLLEFRRGIIMQRQKTLIFQFCRPLVQRWLTTAVLAGRLSIPDYAKNKRRYWRRIQWDADPWDWIDPLKDIQGEVMEVRAGFKSRAQAVSEKRRDIDLLDAEIAQDNARADELKLIFDSDARRTSKQGLYQETEEEDE